MIISEMFKHMLSPNVNVIANLKLSTMIISEMFKHMLSPNVNVIAISVGALQ